MLTLSHCNADCSANIVRFSSKNDTDKTFKEKIHPNLYLKVTYPHFVRNRTKNSKNFPNANLEECRSLVKAFVKYQLNYCTILRGQPHVNLTYCIIMTLGDPGDITNVVLSYKKVSDF